MPPRQSEPEWPEWSGWTEIPLGYLRVVATKTYWRKASAIMACISFNAHQDRDAVQFFDMTWEPKWWGIRVTLVEHYHHPDK